MRALYLRDVRCREILNVNVPAAVEIRADRIVQAMNK
jgi:hypothetical protein